MQIKVKPLVVAMSLALSACNSSDSSTTPTTSSLDGIISDGYISGATICLDVNENSSCDAGEPTATSGEGGKYTLTNIKVGDENHPLIAIVDTGAQDEGGRSFTKRTIFSAPKDERGFISPLSTLIHQKLENNPSLTLEEAKNELIAELGLAVNAAELLTDYVAKEKSEAETSNETKYRDMHRAAQLLTTLIGSELDKAKLAVPNSTNEGAIFELMMKKMLAEKNTLTAKTFIDELKDKLELEKGNSSADFTEFDAHDMNHVDDNRYANFDTEMAEHEALQTGACLDVRDDDGDESDDTEGSHEGHDDDSGESHEGNESDDINESSETCDVTPTTPITPITPTTPSTAVGKALYVSKSCSASSCHGVNPANGMNKIGRAVNAPVTRSAINKNKGGMGFLVGISDADLQAIADYVKNP